ncbi:MAG: adenosylcobinamide-GDP ribazoletransferase [Desulfobacterales bacterium]|nr:adenosylcobinamide-GDP ribazoletransferase [Desulfobacterales bacterium]
MNLNKEFQIFLNAVSFLTRIPIFKFSGYSEENFNNSKKYFPAVGIIVGLISASIFFVANLIFSFNIAVAMSMAATIIITGAFHEDGFADVCDGLFGSFTKKKVLEIMKDSRIGSFAGCGLILILMIKFLSLSEIEIKMIPFVMIAGHSISRFVPLLLMFLYDYVQIESVSKIKDITQKVKIYDLIFAGCWAILPCFLYFFLFHDFKFFLVIIPSVITALLMGMYFKKRIGGYTGDCLGAVQQVSEVIFYIFIGGKLWIYI